LGNDGIPYLNPLSVTPGTTGALDHPFYRNTVPLSEENEAWTGAPRDLTDSQITALAESIVEQVKERGPFLSISDFINRRIGPNSDDRTMMGALQAAIEDQGSSLQGLVDTVGEVTFGSEAPRYWSQNLPNSIKQKPLAFAPGDLTQADILTSIGPLLSARSDTFVIRSLGSVTGPGTGGEETKAWCELIVQRMPEAVDPDPSDPYQTGPFGRQFRVMGIRYLNEDEL
jgi:hypothetical protein